MWFIYFEKPNGVLINTVAVHSNSVRLYTAPKNAEWLVTDNPLDYNPDYLYDRNGKLFSIKLISE